MFDAQALKFEVAETNIPLRNKSGKSEPASVRYGQFAESLTPKTLEDFQASQVKRSYAKGSVLYDAGEASTGIYVIDEGRIKLSMVGGRTGRLHSRTARRGQILGLGPAVSGRPHEMSAHVVVPSQVSFIPKDVLIKLMYQDSEFAYRVLHFLCDDLGKALQQHQRGLGSKRPVTKPAGTNPTLSLKEKQNDDKKNLNGPIGTVAGGRQRHGSTSSARG